MNSRKIVLVVVGVVAVVLIAMKIIPPTHGIALSRAGFKSNIATFQVIDDTATEQSPHSSRDVGDTVRVALADLGLVQGGMGDRNFGLRIDPRDVPALSDWSRRALGKSARISVDDLEIYAGPIREELRDNVSIPMDPLEHRRPGQQALAKAVGWTK